MRYSVLSLNSTLINYEGDSIFLDQYQFSAKILDFINCFCFCHTVKLTSFAIGVTDLQTAGQSTVLIRQWGGGGGGCHWRKEKEVVRITLLQVRVRVLFFFFYLGDRMKIDFLYQHCSSYLFACTMQCTWTMWTAVFLYETLRSKLNLFIQISLNAKPTPPPPPPKKSQAQHICIP